MAGAVLLTLATGCASEVEGVPIAKTTTPTVDEPFGGAPKVPKPIDVGTWRDKPCEAITDEQYKSIGVRMEAGETDPTRPYGPHCARSAVGDGGGHVNLQFRELGLSGSYSGHENQEAFKVLPRIQGFPAVRMGDHQIDTMCEIHVGLNDNTALSVQIYNDPGIFGKKTCEGAKKLVNFAIDTVKQHDP